MNETLMKLIEICLPAIIQIESAGTDAALGDYDGPFPRAYGALQVHQCVLDDVERIYGIRYTLEDMLIREKAIEVFKLYIKYYAHPKRFPDEAVTAERICRIWNGGPMGWRKTSTEVYWKKCEKEIARLYNGH
jgi:hypothetical protein